MKKLFLKSFTVLCLLFAFFLNGNAQTISEQAQMRATLSDAEYAKWKLQYSDVNQQKELVSPKQELKKNKPKTEQARKRTTLSDAEYAKWKLTTQLVEEKVVPNKKEN